MTLGMGCDLLAPHNSCQACSPTEAGLSKQRGEGVVIGPAAGARKASSSQWKA